MRADAVVIPLQLAKKDGPPDPSGATELFEWEGDGRRRSREFVGAQRRVAGFIVCVEGVQHQDWSEERFVTIDRGDIPDNRLTVAAARELAAAVFLAAEEAEQ
jgi:hypothetical protein